MPLEFDAEFEREPIDARAFANVRPPRGFAFGDPVGVVVRIVDLPARGDEFRNALRRELQEAAFVVEFRQKLVRVRGAARRNEQAPLMLVGHVERRVLDLSQFMLFQALERGVLGFAVARD